jgi:hypothetical protein
MAFFASPKHHIWLCLYGQMCRPRLGFFCRSTRFAGFVVLARG